MYTASKDSLSIAYSPGVAEPCLAIKDDEDLSYEYTSRGHLVGVISNGTAVLGLGNIGASASKPVMVGHMSSDLKSNFRCSFFESRFFSISFFFCVVTQIQCTPNLACSSIIMNQTQWKWNYCHSSNDTLVIHKRDET